MILGAATHRSPPGAQAEPDLGVAAALQRRRLRAGGETQIAAIDPERMLSIVDNDELAPSGREVKARTASSTSAAGGACLRS